MLSEYQTLQGTRREKPLAEIAIEKCGFYLPDHARYDYLLNLPEEQAMDKALKAAMQAIEEYKPELKGILPQDEYSRLTRTDKTIPAQLLKTFANIPANASGDLFGQIYEYFLGEFAKAEGQGGGEFFTPRSVVRLMVAMIEPQRGTVYDPACGSGGMFVQSAHFIEQASGQASSQASGQATGQAPDLYVYGQEKMLETVKLAKMNLAVNGLRGEIRQCNSYYEDPYNSFGNFDYVLANPPFNVDDVSLSSVEKDKRFTTYGLPRNKGKEKKADQGKESVPNANYLWINLFASSLKANGRAALVMANSASDARHSEAEIRQKLVEENLIASMVTLPSNFFYTVTLPATLWFFDKAKRDDRILFIDARNIFTQIDRAHREFSDEQIQNIAIISQLHKGQRAAFVRLIDRYFAQGMARLGENQASVQPVSEQLLAVLEENGGTPPEPVEGGSNEITALLQSWDQLPTLQAQYDHYCHAFTTQALALQAGATDATVDAINQAQQQVYAAAVPFFAALHQSLKALDQRVRQHERALAATAKSEGKRATVDRRLKTLKDALAALHDEVKAAESPFQQIHWLQSRFPQAQYEDVTGLCKVATPQEVQAQDYSLNAGRYVGVVIEEDGLSAVEFVGELEGFRAEFEKLNTSSHDLERVIDYNLKEILRAYANI
jgi:type I restriction enzyme M protein